MTESRSERPLPSEAEVPAEAPPETAGESPAAGEPAGENTETAADPTAPAATTGAGAAADPGAPAGSGGSAGVPDGDGTEVRTDPAEPTAEAEPATATEAPSPAAAEGEAAPQPEVTVPGEAAASTTAMAAPAGQPTSAAAGTTVPVESASESTLELRAISAEHGPAGEALPFRWVEEPEPVPFPGSAALSRLGSAFGGKLAGLRSTVRTSGQAGSLRSRVTAAIGGVIAGRYAITSSHWPPRRVVLIGATAGGLAVLVAVAFLLPSGPSGGQPTAEATTTGAGTTPGAPSATAAPAAAGSSSPSPTDLASSPGLSPAQALSTPSRRTSAHPSATAPSGAPAQAAAFAAVGGFGCSGGGAHFQQVGAYNDGTNGWLTVGSGGWEHDSCGGGFEAVPMSGAATKDDRSAYALWTFDVGSASHCSVAVYVPTGSAQEVGGSPAYYTVQDSASGSDYASFDVDQPSNEGSWVPVGDFGPHNGKLLVKLHNRGVDFGSASRDHAHLAAAQIRASCTS